MVGANSRKDAVATSENDSWENVLAQYLSESAPPTDIRQRLIGLIPLDTIVTDLWGLDIHFEEISFDDITEVAFGTDEEIAKNAEYLAEDFLGWIDEYDMDYAQEDWEPGELEEWVFEECLKFMRAWRQNVKKEFDR